VPLLLPPRRRSVKGRGRSTASARGPPMVNITNQTFIVWMGGKGGGGEPTPPRVSRASAEHRGAGRTLAHPDHRRAAWWEGVLRRDRCRTGAPSWAAAGNAMSAMREIMRTLRVTAAILRRLPRASLHPLPAGTGRLTDDRR
jgi:hypothetical protein